MFKRLLVGIGFVHTKDVVHGAIIPPHVMVHPIGHGAKIIDWCYAVDLRETDPKKAAKAAAPDPKTAWSRLVPPTLVNPGPGAGRVKAISAGWKEFYAPEILKKEVVSPSTDIYMAAKCAVYLLGGDVKTGQMPASVPAPIQGFIKSCILASPKGRPQDAWDLHEEFDGLLSKLVGKPTYRELSMPATTMY